MPRLTKEYKNVNCKVDKKIAESMEEFCKKTGLSKTAAIEKALEYFIDNYEKTGKI